MPKLSKVDRAYGELLVLIESGAEYPDALYRITDAYTLSASQVAALERKYDTEPSGRAADEVLTTPELLARIAELQQIQKTHVPTTQAWQTASDMLQPCFAEMARREPYKA